MRTIAIDRCFESWRSAARELLAQNVPPAQVWWADDQHPSLLAPAAPEAPAADAAAPGNPPAIDVPRAFLGIAARVACHRDPARWSLLYAILWRLTHGEKHLLAVEVDPEVRRLGAMERAVRIDRHKMTAFVRFRKIERDGMEHYIAWHKPEHQVVRLAAPFFTRRFGAMRWSIFTPDQCAHWDGRELSFSPGVSAAAAPRADELEELWGRYYASIFNPARIKLAAMRRQMPVKYWSCLPETQFIPQMLKDAPMRVEVMMARKLDEYPSAEAYLPRKITLGTLKEAAAGCKGCPLYKTGTQTVFGEGAKTAKVMFIGEQPGDQEDRAGKPFVGPAGKVLDSALAEAGIDRGEVYVTNAVKHFKWEPRGTRRIHSKPGAREIQACKPWLTAEIQVVKPTMVVALGATAAQALLGKDFRLTRHRGEVFRDTQWAPWLTATVHPSSILRVPDDERERAYRSFVEDLRVVATAIHQAAQAPRPRSEVQTELFADAEPEDDRPPGQANGDEKSHPDKESSTSAKRPRTRRRGRRSRTSE